MKNKFVLPVVLGFSLLVLGFAQSVEAAAFLSIKSGASVKTCDTGGVCLLADGFLVGPTSIKWVGVLNGYSSPSVSLEWASDATGNFLSLSTDKVRHLVASDDLTIDFAGNFDNGAGIPLSAAQTGNYNTAVAGVFSSLTGFAHAGPSFVVGGGDPSVVVPNCIPAVGNNMSCSENDTDVSFASLGVITLLGRQVIHQDVSANVTKMVSYTSSISTGPVVPEPTTILLFGSGLLGVAAFARRRRTKA